MGPHAPGDTLTYTLIVDNNGSTTASGVAVTDPVPAYTAYLAGSLKVDGVGMTDIGGDDAARFDAVNNQTVFDVGDLGAGSTATLSFQVVGMLLG